MDGTESKQAVKRIYVAIVRALRWLLSVSGVLALLDRWASRSRTGLWVRSLLSIYDAEELLALDVPWWTFEAGDAVAEFLANTPGARVFEWGSGASTAWLGSRAGSVVSVEHDAAWGERMRALLPDDCRLLVVEPVTATGPDAVTSGKPGFEGLDFAEYVASIDEVGGEFDLIVIDGRAREACLPRALGHLAPEGMILFDNVDRQRYVDAINGSPSPLDVTWTRGLTPSLPYPTRTAVIRCR